MAAKMFKPEIDYHVVELYQVTAEVRDWLHEKMGIPGVRYIIRGNMIYFELQNDHLMFLLRWS
jgi:hypothetical protein